MNTDFDIVPPEFSYLKVTSASDLVFLGKSPIQAIIQYYRHQAKELSKQIVQEESVLKILGSREAFENERLTGDSLNWRNSDIVTVKIGAQYFQAPRYEVSYAIKPDSTTLNSCGWCKYASSMYTQNTCKLECDCAIQECGKECYTVKEFNTQCPLVFDGILSRRYYTNHLDLKYIFVLAKKTIDVKIFVLQSLAEFADDKPVFYVFRPDNYFHSGSRVYYKIPCHPWEIGVVSVENVKTGAMHIVSDRTGKESTLENDSPFVYHESEILYLRENPEFLEKWLLIAKEIYSPHDLGVFAEFLKS
jgi:hypothetical protein